MRQTVPMPDIAFLHTSPLHVDTFDELLRELSSEARATHRVRADLLAQAQVEGTDSPALIAGVRAELMEAAASRAPVVVCTCSTLGGIAESYDDEAPFRVTRIDRAMADQAVRHGGTVLIVAALASTVAPTSALLDSSCRRLRAVVTTRTLLVPEAWTHFQAGALAAYRDAIVATVSPLAAQVDTVVLAQASMAPAAAPLAALGIRVLSSPRLGLEHALSLR
jgi:hypothetical protein